MLGRGSLPRNAKGFLFRVPGMAVHFPFVRRYAEGQSLSGFLFRVPGMAVHFPFVRRYAEGQSLSRARRNVSFRSADAGFLCIQVACAAQTLGSACRAGRFAAKILMPGQAKQLPRPCRKRELLFAARAALFSDDPYASPRSVDRRKLG